MQPCQRLRTMIHAVEHHLHKSLPDFYRLNFRFPEFRAHVLCQFRGREVGYKSAIRRIHCIPFGADRGTVGILVGIDKIKFARSQEV